jgi:hypothetical protein
MSDLRVRGFVALGGLVAVLISLPAAASGQDRLPNLKAFPAANLSVVANPSTGNPELRLGATSWNSGTGPMELIAGETVGPDQQNVYQRIYNTNGGWRDVLAGAFVWHPAHSHFHLQDYARYVLQPVDAPGASSREGYKTSFCIMDTTKVDGRLSGAAKQAVYTTCNAVKQGMSVGWGDTYGPHLAGQSVDLTGNPDGLYELTIEFDWKNHLVESNDNDNTACSLLRISVVNRTVETVGACGTTGSNITVTSVTPNAVLAGTVTDLTITGSNFFPGIAVGFENGSGPAPVLSNITVLDSSTITATVTVKTGGGRNNSVWDIRVGSAVLVDGFTVLR